MTIEEFTSQMEAKLAAMSDEELISSLKRAGCTFIEGTEVESFWTEEAFTCSSHCWAHDSNELALAA